MTSKVWPKVTIMIPTFNQEEFIQQAVTSALAQDYPNLEVIVGDDCSTDRTEELISEIHDHRLKYVRNPQNLGRTENYRNILFNHGTGEYVVNLDGDDYYTDAGFISSAINAIGEDKDVVIVAARVSTVVQKKIVSISSIPDLKEIQGIEILKKLPNKKYNLMHMSTIYARHPALESDFYRCSVISSDWESLYRLVLKGKVKFLDRVVGVWRIHGENETSTTDLDKLLSNLDIWPTIYNETTLYGIQPFISKIYYTRCIAHYTQISCVGLSKYGIKILFNFLIKVFLRYKWVPVILMFMPFTLVRIFMSFLGYYRLRVK